MNGHKDGFLSNKIVTHPIPIACYFIYIILTKKQTRSSIDLNELCVYKRIINRNRYGEKVERERKRKIRETEIYYGTFKGAEQLTMKNKKWGEGETLIERKERSGWNTRLPHKLLDL